MSKVTYTQTITLENKDSKAKVANIKKQPNSFNNIIESIIQEFNAKSAPMIAEMKALEGNPALVPLAAKYTPIFAKTYSDLVQKNAAELNALPTECRSKVNEAIAQAKTKGLDTEVFVAIHNKMEALHAQKTQSQKLSVTTDALSAFNSELVH